jgi:hypothetical protein
MVAGRADSDMSPERLPTATAVLEAYGCRGRPARGRSPCMKQGHVRAEDPEGGYRRCGTGRLEAAAHRGGAKRRSRRATAAGRWYPRVTLADGGAPLVRPATQGEMHGQDRELFLVCPALFMEQARTISTRPNTSCVCLRLTGLEHGQQAGSAPQGPGVTVTGTVESGRPPTGGPVRSDRKEPRSSRVTSSLRDYVPLREERYSSLPHDSRSTLVPASQSVPA